MKDIAKKRELQAAWDVAGVMADFELQTVVNRAQVFKTALSAPDFKAGVYEQLRAFDEANKASAQRAFDSVRKLTEREYKLLYGEGVSAVDEAVHQARAKGYEAPARQKRGTNALTNMLLVTLGRFAGTLLTGREQAQKQLLQITSQVNTAYDIPEQLSRAQSVYAGKGLTVKQGATEKDIVALSEFQLRNDGRNLQLKAEGERSAEYDMHYFQISGHPSSCPLCTPWQGKIVIDDVFADGKPDGKTPLMSEAIADGLYHYNCRHERTVYIPGVSKPNLYSKDIASMKETATRYAIEQQQRYNERGIREWKLREAAALTEKEQQLAQYKIKEWQAKQHDLRKIAKQEGVPFYRQYSREQIGGETIPTAPLLYDAKGDIIDARAAFYSMPYEKMGHLKGKLSNEDARGFYVSHVSEISQQVEKGETLREKAIIAFNARNKARVFTRELMKDKQAVARLDEIDPVMPWQNMIKHKMQKKGLAGSEVYADIIRSSVVTRASVNQEMGVYKWKRQT